MQIAEIFLWVCVAGSTPGTPNYLCRQHLMPSMEVCQQAVQSSFKTPPSNTGEKGMLVFAYCAPDGEWSDQRRLPWSKR